METKIIKTGIKNSCLFVALMCSFNTFAGDNTETLNNTQTQIIHRVWNDVAMPLEWYLHEDGVITNDVNMQGTPAINNATAVTELSDAFQAWEAVVTSDISVSYAGETSIADAGCDLVNLVTWSDTAIPLPANAIAASLTTMYVGPDIVLNAGNRNLPCGFPGSPNPNVNLPVATYPNGTLLEDGNILDMDMIWNAAVFDFSTNPNATPDVFDIQAIATHEFGHHFGFAHTSMSFNGVNAATMFPAVSDTDIAWQNNVRTLNADDVAVSGLNYPGIGFWPDGSAPYTTGAISGWVRQPDASAAVGVRVWAYSTADPLQPAYETFTVHPADWDPSLSAGDYILKGLTPGTYNVCIVSWLNGVPFAGLDDPTNPASSPYNITPLNGSGHIGFPTECYDDAPSITDDPTIHVDLVEDVLVVAGNTTPDINFVTGIGDVDVMLVLDRSGSMNLSATGGAMTKIEALQLSANSFIDFLDLDGGHRLGLVQFNDAVVPFAPPFDLQNLNAASRPNAQTAINGMLAGGMTNIIDGVDEAVNQLTSVADPHDRQVVFVFSDGMHNSPWGSDLMDINAPIVSNDLNLYSLAIGTSVSGAILSTVAMNSGGDHLEHQSATPADLQKFFISVAAQAVDLATLVDPLYEMSAGDADSLTAFVTNADKNLTFTMNWDTPNQNQFNVSVETPSGCTIGTIFTVPGVDIRRGETHRHIKIPLPFRCGKNWDKAGEWVLNFTSQKSEHEQTQLIAQAYSDSNLRMFSEISIIEDVNVVTARLVNEGEIINEAAFTADVVIPVPSTDDSYQDDQGEGGKPRPIEPEEKRTVRLVLTDDGRGMDQKAGDGIFTAKLPIGEIGSHRMLIKSEFKAEGDYGKREHVTAYFFDGKNVIQADRKR
ncbi:VWA domain-containing protein [Aliikangiella marina]|nr:VWA domain-containing protein [Aliikangiella marina]